MSTGTTTTGMNAITRALSNAKGVAAWSVCEKTVRSHQRYRIFQSVESERTAQTRSVQITLHTEATRDGKPVIGESSFTLTGDATDISPRQIDTAVTRARLVANPGYRLPGKAPVPAVDIDDPAVANDPWGVIAQLTQQMDAGAERMPVCASEFFVDRSTLTVATSEGFYGQYTGTELFTEFVLLNENGRQSVECHGMDRARRAQELALADTVARHVTWTVDRMAADLPPTLTLPVVFGEEALDTLFDTFVAHAGAKARFDNWSRLEEGKELIEGTTGDRLTLSIDPTLPWGLNSRPFDGEGQINQRVEIVRDGRFVQRTANKRYGDYLGIPATGSGGNLVVASGTTPLAELLANGPVLHALRFSTFHPNGVTGAFSGELRTAYLIDEAGRSIPVCGGSVSGNVWEAFKTARLSAERTTRSGYDGPAGVYLEGVTLAGRSSPSR